MNRCRGVLILLIFGMSLAGCGNRTELNDLGITSSTGFDRHNGNWTITYQVIVPPASSTDGSSGGGSQAAVTTFSSQGKTIREALSKSSVENPRKLYFAHTNVILIGKETAAYGIAEIIDSYYRNIDARETVKVLIADGEARDYLKKLVPPDKLPGNALSEILQRNMQRGSFYPPISLHELALKITSDSGAAGIPIVTVQGHDTTKLESIDILKQTSFTSKLRLGGLGVFYKDKKVGVLSQKQSLGLSWLTDQVKKTNLSYVGTNGEHNSFIVQKAKVKVVPIRASQHYTLKVDAKVNAELDESTSSENIVTAHNINKLQDQAEQMIKAQIQEGWNAIRQLHVDLIGIANKIHQKHPKDWKSLKDSWPKKLAEMDININVDVSLNRTGLFQDSFNKLLGSENERENSNQGDE